MDGNKEIEVLRDYALGLVAEIIESREKEGKAPYMAFHRELMERLHGDFSKALRGLVKEGALDWHQDINGNPMFEFKKKG